MNSSGKTDKFVEVKVKPIFGKMPLFYQHNIDEHTRLREFKNELRQNDLTYTLSQGLRG